LERRAIQHTSEIAVRDQPWPLQTEFESARIWRVADETIADGQGKPVGGAPDRDTQAPVARPAAIDKESA
jgi:hypothetical protein